MPKKLKFDICPKCAKGCMFPAYHGWSINLYHGNIVENCRPSANQDELPPTEHMHWTCSLCKYAVVKDIS